MYPRFERKKALRSKIRAVFRQRQIQGGVQKSARAAGKKIREKLVVHACFRLAEVSRQPLAGYRGCLPGVNPVFQDAA
jgi:hypothetical protein